jgi:hypothetical protein
VARAQSRRADAERFLTDAGRIADQIGVTAAQAATLRGLGALLLSEDRPRDALRRLERAATLATEARCCCRLCACSRRRHSPGSATGLRR